MFRCVCVGVCVHACVRVCDCETRSSGDRKKSVRVCVRVCVRACVSVRGFARVCVGWLVCLVAFWGCVAVSWQAV